MRSDEQFQLENERIWQRANAALYRKYGLGITKTTGNRAQMEEEYMVQQSGAGRFIHKIPGISASERAYIGYLNCIRADYFDFLVNKFGRGGERALSQRDYKAITQFVNDATGRAGMGKHDMAAATLAQVFFSPRFVTSRFKIITGAQLRNPLGWSRAPPQSVEGCASYG